jgi:hypothetical protein
MIGWGHKESGTPLDSLTGTKEWEAPGSTSTPAAVHTVQNHPGRYGFKIEFDGVEEDAEIIVDPPPAGRPRGKAKGARAKVSSAARRTAGKTARRPAKMAKPATAKKAKPSKAKKAARKSAPRAKARGSRKRGARRR